MEDKREKNKEDPGIGRCHPACGTLCSDIDLSVHGDAGDRQPVYGERSGECHGAYSAVCAAVNI